MLSTFSICFFKTVKESATLATENIKHQKISSKWSRALGSKYLSQEKASPHVKMVVEALFVHELDKELRNWPTKILKAAYKKGLYLKKGIVSQFIGY